MALLFSGRWIMKLALNTFDLKSGATCCAGLTVLAIALGFLATGCASRRAASSKGDHPKEKAQIEQRIQEVLKAAETKDFNHLDSYHLYGPKFTKFTGSSPERLDAVAGRKGEHEGLSALNGMKMSTEAVKIDVFGNVGIATFILDYSFDLNGQTTRGKERATLVFVKDSGSWKIAHEHFSPINA
jgi:ketosteroid isomerase-like protein